MILAHLSDPLIRQAVRRAARPDEDVVWDPAVAADALRRGFPRLVLRAEGARRDAPLGAARSVPVLVLDGGMLQRWERARMEAPVPPARVDFLSAVLRLRIRESASGTVWVDRALADLARLSGEPLPRPFRGLARRVLEFPSRYPDLGAFEELTGLSRGAIKARFRRRELDSPTHWLRLLRVIAAAHLLSDRSVTTLHAAYRLGFRDSGNFCRLVQEVGGMTPTEAREPAGRLRLLSGVASALSDAHQRRGWDTLAPLFLEGAA